MQMKYAMKSTLGLVLCGGFVGTAFENQMIGRIQLSL
jgi:hypothetical protein